MNSILNIGQKYKVDESISNYETYGFYPITGTNLNNAGTITITVQNSDCFYQPSRSWLEFEGKVESTTTDYTADSLISLANNGIMYLFDSIRYLLSSAEVESVFHPGHASTIMGLAKYPSSYNTGLSQCWAPDSDDTPTEANTGFKARRGLILTSKPDPLGSFRFAVPLSHIFGFCEDYDKVIYGFQHSIVLTRSSSDHNALFRKANSVAHPEQNVPPGKVTLDKLRWMLPRCSPSVAARLELTKQIESKEVLDVGFRMRQCITTVPGEANEFTWRLGVRSSPEQPRYIFIAFQKGRHDNQEKNIATYDNCDLTSAHILLNGDRYPLNDFDIDFKKNHFDTVYEDFASFIQRFYGLDRMVVSSAVDPLLYKSIYPILMFDVSKQSERFKSGITDITVHCQFKENLDTTVRCHAMMISDRKLRFQSDGSKMVVLY